MDSIPRLAVVAHPDNRRARLFADAVRAAGLPPPSIVPWRRVAAGDPFSFQPGQLVRIESPGEDAETDRLLRGADRPAEHGEIAGLAAWYRGLRAALGRIDAAARAAGAVLHGDIDEILAMCDKRACHARLQRAGVPVPPALRPVTGYRQLLAAMAEAGWSRVFVKPRYGSSASGLMALGVHSGRARARTSVELVGPDRLFNSLRVRTYANEADVATIVDALAPDGLHVERWFPKAGLAGRVLDLRVVVIAGRPSHVVVRQSRSPMTNLHLGGARGDLGAVRRAAGPGYEAALHSCVRAAACFPASPHVGVDLMFSSDWRRHAVAEVNAFGDLLPGLLVNGRDTYAAQVAALARIEAVGSRVWT